jgi:hypothetical protein
MQTVERRIVGTAAVLTTRTVAPEHVSSVNCRRPAKHSRTLASRPRRPLHGGPMTIQTTTDETFEIVSATVAAEPQLSVRRDALAANVYLQLEERLSMDTVISPSGVSVT